MEAYSPAAGRYRALYDALGRRVGQEIIRETGTTRTYYVYEGDTIVAEVDGSGRIVAEYVWGLLGPIARIDLQNPANTRYYVIDGLGHVRALVSPSGIITDRYTYDSWGNLIEQAGDTPNPFTWNGAYGYEFIPFTGLYHVGAREYDPRTARWLQRDPIDVAGGHPNVYAYCLNQPVTRVDPSGMDCVVVFIHGTMSRDTTFSKEFIDYVADTLGATGRTYNYSWQSSKRALGATANRYSIQGDEAEAFADYVKQVQEKHSGLPIVVVGHSNGGNVAAFAAQNGAPINAIIRLGSPPDALITPERMQNVIVFDVYDPNDTVAGSRPNLANAVGFHGGRHEGSCWYTIRVNAPASRWNFISDGIEKHMNMHSVDVWKQLLANDIFKQFADSTKNYKRP